MATDATGHGIDSFVAYPPSVSVLASAVTVGTTAGALPATSLTGRRSIEVYNNGSVDIFLGDSAVTTSTGIPVAPGSFYSCDIGTLALYAISGSASQNVRVLEKA